MVIDMRKFYGNEGLMDDAIAACKKAHNLPEITNDKGEVDHKSEIKWIWKAGYGNVFPEHSPGTSIQNAR